MRLERSQPIGLRISELPFRELTNVRGRADAPLLSAAIRNILQIALPEKPNTVAAGPTHLALWLGPDEWLLQSREPRAPSIERALRSLLAGEHAAVIDVSSGYAILRLSGETARAAPGDSQTMR
jgi:sarcosine oxidase, subunit gamma